MFDLAPRTTQIKSSTGEYVGPNTYVICSSLRSRKKNVVPFCSTDNRTPSFIGRKVTDALYNVSGAPKTLIIVKPFDIYGNVESSRNKLDTLTLSGGSSLRNRGERFIYRDDDTPGPTKYNPRLLKCKKCPKLDPTKPKLYACHVPYSITDSVPSVPTKIDENGYDVDDEGKIRKNPPDPPEPPINKPLREPLSSGELYKGCKWSTRSSRRFETELNSTPGPGEYDVKLPECPRSQADEEYREMARLFSFLPRYIEGQELKTKREGLPGPGWYELARPISAPSASIKPRPFISGTSRFRTEDGDGPAPDRYKICDCYRNQRQFSTKCAPFGYDSPRFRWKVCDDEPGPASYSLKSPLREKLDGKRSPFAVFRAPFDGTAKRDISFAPRDAALTPSPAHYPQESGEIGDENGEIHASVFRSTVDRFPATAEKDRASCASYDVSKIVNRMRSKCSHNVRAPSFDSTGPRDTSMGGRFGGPGPADNCDRPACRPGSKGFHFKKSPRFAGEAEETPGPGQYDVESCERAVTTHNLRLKENAWRTKLRLAPKTTRRRWLDELNRKKFLSWFKKEETVEEKKILRLQRFIEEDVPIEG